MDDKRFALLIDADNISAKYIKYILDEISKYGVVTYKRIYGDWTKSTTTSWKNELLENSINPVQQFSYTTGKNATDSAMIIDAMDILYTNSVDGFCIASSDSDFTKLASRLRESGMMVIGMGEDKTPKPFRVACDRFTCLDILLDSDVSENISNEGEQSLETEGKTTKSPDTNKLCKSGVSVKKNKKSISNSNEENTNKKVIENTITKIITENENEEKVTTLGEIGSRLVKMYPDFDVRNYGYSLLSKFLEEFTSLRMTRINNIITVELMDNTSKKEEIQDFIVNIVKSKGSSGISLNEMSRKIHSKYKDFNVRDYGYSKFSKYIQEISELNIVDDTIYIK
ncbi:Uncharacterized conserved protein, LabA/DUF88 family [Hathewaya proteolytica DSM 3090]|uniref:Uncharacterized conserved protein, LabA/DUF88 family n=1 Tax=Hathewaya proteolytica DSM 3090 TaxID=1121331 RepID=A0A1M6MD34_9CLOT|nr:NYN domain-containing protein [Hathewaya proteolytica]SHJ81330.1 Uncharacterized conserved protein, LabA/DUF88 family [Hathewaya proteolytica DSM 3090]